ncbi:Glycosyl transferase family 2 [Tenacibaculum litopenaei]
MFLKVKKRRIKDLNNKVSISAAIVLYKEDLEELRDTIHSFLEVPLSKKLYLIDNTPNSEFEDQFAGSKDVVYIANSENVGFGKAHNQVKELIAETSEYHLILNPDVAFEATVIPNLIERFSEDKELAMIAPKVLFPDGRHQYSCRKYPSFFELLIRRLGPLKSLFRKQIEKGEYRDLNLSKSFYPEYITGCFQLYKTVDFMAIEGFDERYFLYMEDVDICKKIDELGKKKRYEPSEIVVHNLKQGSSKSPLLFIYHLSSAVKYFKKWT